LPDYCEDVNDVAYDEYLYNKEQEDRTWRSVMRRLRRLERKLGLPRHRVVLEPERKIYDMRGNLLLAHIPKPDERFYEKIRGGYQRVDREVGAIYVYSKEAAGMTFIEYIIHECVERLEDARDKPGVEAINSLITHLNDLIENILKDKGSSSQLIELAIAKREHARKNVSQLSEKIYQEREKVVAKLVPQLIKKTTITDNEEYERGLQLFNEVYLSEGDKSPRKKKLTKKEQEVLNRFIRDCMLPDEDYH